MIQTMLSMAVVIGVALLVGFRPTAGPVDWIAAIGVLAMITLALTWLSVALGMVSKSVETASNLPMFLMLLPFLGSGFVPTDSMPAGVRWFAENQPFTPIMETLRGLADGHPDRPPQRRARHRLVRRHRAGRVPVGQAPVQPRPDAVTGRRFSPCAGGP